MTPRFISLEGIEGSGKSSLARGIAQVLADRQVGCWLTAEPYDKAIRSILLDGRKLNAEAELLLFLADRAAHRDEIKAHLRQGDWVVCDRYLDSTNVYQGYARGFDLATVKHMNAFAAGDLIPEITLLLDVPVEMGLARQVELNRIGAEKLAFHQMVRDGFLTEAALNPARFRFIDATQPKNVVLIQALIHLGL
ncbi:MAG: dTMP kinase [Armatimonadota bacterium]